jgi:hypothetical protein
MSLSTKPESCIHVGNQFMTLFCKLQRKHHSALSLRLDHSFRPHLLTGRPSLPRDLCFFYSLRGLLIYFGSAGPCEDLLPVFTCKV